MDFPLIAVTFNPEPFRPYTTYGHFKEKSRAVMTLPIYWERLIGRFD
jgi:hypothetical protein